MRKKKYLLGVLLSFVFMIGVFSVSILKPIDNDLILNAQSVTDDREFKAAWVTPLVGDVSLNGESTFKNNMNEVLDIMEYYGLNVLMFHVRTHNNAFYDSSINPKASYISNIDFNRFDPVEWLINESHRRGIEFHAWMNPYRYSTTYQVGSMPYLNPQTNSSNTLEGRILNPALSNVKNHIYDTIDEFIEMYPTVDGIHFDDYFYVSTSASPTSANARREHINDLVETIHSRISTFNANNNRYIQFGISPTGIYKNGNGSVTYDSNGHPITTGSNSRGQEHYEDYLYADTLKWITEGWLDYIVPQVYWARDLSAAPFYNVLSWWDKVVKYLDVNLYTGIGLYKALETGGAGWYTNSDEMNAQFNIIENDLNNVLGYAIFSFKHLKMAYNGDSSIVGRQVNNAYNSSRRKIKVLPEIKSMTPVIPEAVSSTHYQGNVSWSSVNNAKFYYIYASSGELTYSSDEIIGVIGDNPGIINFTVDNYNPNLNYGVRALSPTNHLSPIEELPPVEVYDITYYLDGGELDTCMYLTRDEMIIDFLTDFYNFVNPAVDLNTFIHGPGKTSGFDGLYDGDYFNELFNNNDKSINPGTNKFINQPEYNKWVPLLDLMHEYTITGRSSQTFWNSQYTAVRRIKPFIQQVNLWDDEGEPKASVILEIVNRIPALNEGESGVYYQYTENYPNIVLPNAFKEGYRFLGWYTDYYGGERVTIISKGTTGDLNFYARWEERIEETEEILITFNLDYDGKYLTPQTVEKGSNALEPASPSREHYNFLGWYLNGNLFDFSEEVYDNVNLVARWEFSSYYVKFKDYDGTVLKEEIVLPGGSATAPSNPTRVGYTFISWDKSYRNVYSDLDVFAEYSSAKYFVEFYDSDGTLLNSYLVNHGETISEPTPPVKEGYNFLGWHLDNELYDFNTPVKNDIVLTAWWDTARYTVTFLNEDGSVFLTQYVEEGRRVSRPSTSPYYEGYTFDAWYYNDNPYNFNNLVFSNLVLMPTWNILVHTVRFLDYDHSEINRIQVEHGSQALKVADPLRYGYTFRDWYLGDIPYNFNYAVYEDVVLIAHWDINIYTVRFLDHDKTVLSEQSIAHGSSAISPSTPNNKEGHIFLKWDRSFDNIVNYTEINAVYSPVNLFVEFIDDDGSHINTVVVGYGMSINRPSNPYKEGFVFSNWLLDGDVFEFNTLIYEDIVLKASYEFGGYVVTFLNHNNTVFIRQSVINGGYADKPMSDPYKEGYKFNSWQKDGVDFNFNTPITSDITLTPSWSILVHVVRFLDSDGTEIARSYVEHANRVSRISDIPEKPGFTFRDWYLGDAAYDFRYGVYEDINLFARWDEEFYTVRFFDDDGTVLKVYNDVSYGSNLTPPNNPTKEGHYFSKWDKGFSNITENLDITAIYEKHNYFVYFYDHNGSTVDTKLIKYQDKVTPPGTPYREGYTFMGWTLDGNLFDFDTLITEEIRLYTSWEIKTYTVTFLDSNVVLDELILPHGSKVPVPTDPVKENFDFSGWLLFGSLYNFDSSVVMDMTLTAGWVSSGYKVTFLDSNGLIFKTVTVLPNEKVEIPEETPYKEGYKFDGWLLNGIVYSFNMPVVNNITLEPSYKIIKHTINFLDADSTILDTVVVDHGTKLIKPENPVKVGHTFVDWYLGDLAYNFNFVVYDSIDLIARWTVNTYRVRFFVGQDLLKSENVKYKENAIPPQVPAKEGYDFSGWDKSYTNITENRDISATYEVSKYEVTFKDHEKVIKVVTVEHGKSVVGPVPTERIGYEFIGWDRGFTNITSNIEVTALYRKIEFTVKFYDYYDNVLKEEVVKYGEVLTPPEIPIVEGAVFKHWLEDAALEYDINNPVIKDLELYAHYEVFEYLVRFLDYDGKVLKEEGVFHGNPATPPEAPVRSGYTFSGWGENYTVIKDDIDIYARYIKEDITAFTVRFLNDDESVFKEELVNENESIVRPINPEKEGHTFKYWTLDGEVFDFETLIKEDITLKAFYEVNVYQVIYREREIIASIDVLYGSIITVPEVPSKRGYEGSWEIDLTDVVIKKDYDINAVYSLIDYKITYHNTREAVNNNPLTHTLLEVVYLEDLESINENNGFVGWYDEDDNEVVVLAGVGDKEVYAKWQVNEYIVKFLDYNGNLIDQQVVVHGESAVSPSVPNREHYNHIGWDRNFTNVRYDLIVNAVYAGVEYTITYNTLGGSLIESETITYPNLLAEPENPLKKGYQFNGWFKDQNYYQKFSFDEPLTSDITVYANYRPNSYLVTFIDDLGKVILQTEVFHGEDAVAPKNIKKEHYTHVGWDSSLENVTENKTIKAIFEANSYTLSFDVDGGSLINDESYVYPTRPDMPNIPEKAGYDFVGWFTDNNYTKRFNFNMVLEEDTTIYARWLEQIDDNKYISMYQSASIRYKTDTSSQGLKFSARLNEDVKYNEHGFYLVYGKTTVDDLRMAINNKNRGKDFIINDKKVFKVEVPSVDLNNTFNVVLTGIPEHGYIDNISVIAYVLVNGEEHFTLKPTTRSVAEVAFKSLNYGELNNALLDVVNNIEQKIVYSTNVLNEMELNNNFYEYNHAYLKEEFNNDFLRITDKNYNDLETLERDLRSFYSDTFLREKWMFLLDYFLSITNNSNLNSQIRNIKNNNYNNYLKELVIALNNFFNEENEFTTIEVIDFTNLEHYLKLKQYNNSIYINPNNYYLYTPGEEILLMGVIEDEVGYEFSHYLIDGEIYKALDTYIVEDKSVVFKKVFVEVNFTVTFISDAAYYYEMQVLPFEKIDELPPVYKVGFNFVGWYTKDDILYDVNTLITEDIVLYAKFEAINYIEEVEVYIDSETYEVISHSENITVTVYYDYNYVNVIISADPNFEIYYNVSVSIYFNDELAVVVSFEVNKNMMTYILKDPNYTGIY